MNSTLRGRHHHHFRDDHIWRLLKREDDAASDVVAKVLREHPEIKLVRIEGHTDSFGNPGGNKRLSERRAQSVQRWLIARGKIDAGRLQARGYGQDKPIATNDTKEGRQRNRRVVFTIVQNNAAPSETP